MSGRGILLTHAEVEIDPTVPVPDWGLSAEGRARHARFATHPMLRDVAAIHASTERKAREGARAAGDVLGLPVTTLAELGENDRSATGSLPPEELQPIVTRFFDQPDASACGRETARHAQARIVEAVGTVPRDAPDADGVLIVSRGGVGALLRCHLAVKAITSDEGQPHKGGGCWFAFGRAIDTPTTEWTPI